MKYLKLFDTESAYKAYRDGGVHSTKCITKYRPQQHTL